MGISSEVADGGHGSEGSAHGTTVGPDAAQGSGIHLQPGHRRADGTVMTDQAVADLDTVHAEATMEDRLRAMHVTLLFIAVLLCVMLGMNIILIASN